MNQLIEDFVSLNVTTASSSSVGTSFQNSNNASRPAAATYGSATGRNLCTFTPAQYLTSAPSNFSVAAAVIPSSGDTAYDARSAADPPPAAALEV